jgi:hypothetical protein
MPEKGVPNGNMLSAKRNTPEPRQAVTPMQSTVNSPQRDVFQEQAIGNGQSEFVPVSRQTPERQQTLGSEHSSGYFDTPRDPIHSISGSISPLLTPGTTINSFIPVTTPMAGYDEFTSASSKDDSEHSSPGLIMDWSQIHFSTAQLDHMRSDLVMATPVGNQLGLTIDSMANPGLLSMLPEFSQSIDSIHSSMTTPRLSMSTTLSDLEMASSNGALEAHTRHTSISEPSIGDLSAIIKAQDGWNCFRSIPTLPPSQCPRTARLHLEKLEQCLKNHEGWRSWMTAVDDSDSNDYLTVMDFDEYAKDKLLAIMQSFLHKAIETHRNSNITSSNGRCSPLSIGSSFILLPPVKILKYFLSSYVNTFERFFPMTSRGALDVNDQILNPTSSDRASSLLTLMMIAAGSLFIPSMDARWLNGGLTEACRISLFDMVETNISMASDHTVLHAALLFTATAAWGGDKWHMNMAMGQRGMYTAMLRHSGALEPQYSALPPHATTQQLWQDWLIKESRSRLVYSWAILDQDLAFFHDTMPLFQVTEFWAPMPDSDRLWHSKSAAEWSTVFSQVHEFSNGYSSIGSEIRPMSLNEFFRRFIENDLVLQSAELTPLQLRLLLHPLQSLISQFRQYASCFSSGVSQSPTSSPSLSNPGSSTSLAIHTASSQARYRELQALLQKWQDLAIRYLNSHPVCPVMQAALTMFHLISLNAAINFPAIEKLARKENNETQGEMSGFGAGFEFGSRPIYDETEALFHAGQVLRLVRAMPRSVRPPWWSAAIYRVVLVLWAIASIKETAPSQYPHLGASQHHLLVGIDNTPTDNPMLVEWRSKGHMSGILPILNNNDGSAVPIDSGFAVVLHCMEVLDEGVSNRFSDGIRIRLERLARG